MGHGYIWRGCIVQPIIRNFTNFQPNLINRSRVRWIFHASAIHPVFHHQGLLLALMEAGTAAISRMKSWKWNGRWVSQLPNDRRTIVAIFIRGDRVTLGDEKRAVVCCKSYAQLAAEEYPHKTVNYGMEFVGEYWIRLGLVIKLRQPSTTRWFWLRYIYITR